MAWGQAASPPTLDLRELRAGDVLFQQSTSSQSKAISLATDSQYTHMGILVEEGEDLLILEAIQPVSLSPVEPWVARGVDQRALVTRLRQADELLTDQSREQLTHLAREFVGRSYDAHFGWGDEELYCSELVYKALLRVSGVQVGELKPMSDFDLSHPVVRRKLHERYGPDLPLDTPMLAPQAMLESEHLVVIGTIE